jgi:hypothetical protein
VALLASYFLAAASSAFRTLSPRSFRFFFTVSLAPRRLFPRSAAERYLPLRKPAARG